MRNGWLSPSRSLASPTRRASSPLGHGERGTLQHRRWGRKKVLRLWKTVWQFHRKLNVHPPHRELRSQGSAHEKPKTCFPTKTETRKLVSTTALSVTAPNWKQGKRSSNGKWMNEMWLVGSRNRITFGNKNKVATDQCYNAHKPQKRYTKWKKARCTRAQIV